ncbi:MAG: hypothetical protein RBS39_09255 [Phycisphaerales bacterium]|jgi:hypothetical protein|nr:hypothetical protein [Phycisphaerales bacterium]
MRRTPESDQTHWTVARIAAHLGVDRHRVEYLIDARGIRPTARVGIARVFASEDVAYLGSELARIAAAREGVRHGRSG